MDRTRFDNLTRLMATGQNRRAVLRGLIGGMAGVTALRHLPTAAGEICIEAGLACVMEAGATPCCDSPCYTCFEGTCDYGGGRGTVDAGCTCETGEDCFESTCVESVCTAEEEICKELGAACEMVAEHGCCGCLTCFEAQCDFPKGCVDDGCPCDDVIICCEGMVCNGGTCGTGEEVPDTGGGVQLPTTGTGGGSGSNAWVAAALAGGAAVIAAKTVKRPCGSKKESEG